MSGRFARSSSTGVAPGGLARITNHINVLVVLIIATVPIILAPAMQPRIVVTLEEEKDKRGPTSKLQPVPITCHVGTAVDVVGQAGKPKTITGFQTHNTPVLLGVGERVELASEKYLSYAPFIEGFVIVKENPDFVE